MVMMVEGGEEEAVAVRLVRHQNSRRGLRVERAGEEGVRLGAPAPVEVIAARLRIHVDEARAQGCGDSEDGRELALMEGHTNSVNAVSVSADGRLAASASTDATVRIWDLVARREKSVLEGHRGFVTSVALSADGLTVLSGGGDRTMRLWQVADGRQMREFLGHKRPQ